MKPALNIARIIVGVLFIFSGLVKANDPLGLSYKMQEFFEAWHWTSLDQYTLGFSILMIAFEIIAGIAVLLGWQMRLFSWLLLLLIVFFTFLTGYAVLSGKIRTCGCFGDCIPLTAVQSFTKDLVLTALIIFIFLFRNQVKPLFGQALSISLLVLGTFFSFGLQGYVLKHLPIVDCLPYKVGKNLLQQMKVPPGSVPDSTVITLVYNKAGKEVEFTADNFPDDYDDSIYHFLRRYDKVIRVGNAQPPIKDFVLTSASGNDTTHAILEQSGPSIILFVKDEMDADPSKPSNKVLAQLMAKAQSKQIPFYLVSNMHNMEDQVQKAAGIKPVGFLCDAVAIKTAARANPTIYLLQDGTVVNKWAHADFEKALAALSK